MKLGWLGLKQEVLAELVGWGKIESQNGGLGQN